MLISVSRHGGKHEKMDRTSSLDVEMPGCELKFNFARDVAMRYTFEPEGNPYFVIPRVHDNSISKPYVLGLLMDTYAGNGIRVEFKGIDRECRVFQNMPTFSVKGMTRDVSTEYQIRNPRQPSECVGAELKDERLKEFGVYEN
ncbi:putative calpain-like cysteine peptidase [Trypanosoma cruzi]|nr:putative calpain-like cysteine peptidase [Trypanosoma cruzi]